MAISKTQPMRSAEIDIIDEVNALDNLTSEHTNSISTLSDDLADEILYREQGDENLQGQIGEGFSPIFTIAQSLGNIAQSLGVTSNAVSDIETIIGDGFSSQNTITAYRDALVAVMGDISQLDNTVVNLILGLIDANEILKTFSDRFMIGIIENITIPANDSVSTSHIFTTPFLSTDSCILVGQVVTNELSSMFTYTLTSCTYSGFSYSISNSDTDAHTVALGYVAIKVN